MSLAFPQRRSHLIAASAASFALVFAIDAFALSPRFPWPPLRALFDSPSHAALAFAVTLPWAARYQLGWKPLLIAVAAAILIDLDHFIFAWSISLRDATTLSARPATQSLPGVLLLAGLLGLLTRRRSVFLLSLLALLTHITRDASSGRVEWLWPLASRFRVPPAWNAALWGSVILLGVMRFENSRDSQRGAL